ncbi:twin-arginine translocase TatA/TatE family subunit [Slackia piriformis]|nr:twin-arginine translocase TatA/TatE family subunit [Slackia piriformis]
MFGIGGTELFLILLFGFLLFGPDKLPSIAKTAGKAIAKFRNAQEEVTKVVQNEIYDPKSDEPFKNPLDAVEKLGKKSENKTVAKQESFSERKARYDRERAARRAAEQEKAAEGASSDTAAGTAKTATKPAPKAASTAKPASSAASNTTTNTPSTTSEEKGE